MNSNLNGFVKLHRKMIEWGWYSDCVVKDVFLHILMVATFKETSYLGYELHPGQAVIGLKKLSTELGFSVQQIRTALKKLESTGEITLFSTNKFTIATVENWEFYQCDEIESNKRATNEQQTNNKRATNEQQHLKNVKNVKNVNNVKKREGGTPTRSYGKFKNVILTPDEYKDISDTYRHYRKLIERVSVYLANTDRKYKNHYALAVQIGEEDNYEHKPIVMVSADAKSVKTEDKGVPMPDDIRMKIGKFIKGV